MVELAARPLGHRASDAVAVLSPKALEGRAMGLYNALIGGAGIVGSLAGGHLAQAFGYSASFGAGAVLMGLAAAWMWKLRTALQAERAGA